MTINFSLDLENDLLILRPIRVDDFDELFSAASDPLIWEQHPNHNRYRRGVFKEYFQSAIDSGSAYVIIDKANNTIIGSSRDYDPDVKKNSIAIGYTFLDRAHWGGIFNSSLKKLMIDYAFNFFDQIVFHIGSENIRSQKAIEKVGGRKIEEVLLENINDPGESNFIYCIEKSFWNK